MYNYEVQYNYIRGTQSQKKGYSVMENMAAYMDTNILWNSAYALHIFIFLFSSRF